MLNHVAKAGNTPDLYHKMWNSLDMGQKGWQKLNRRHQQIVDQENPDHFPHGYIK